MNNPFSVVRILLAVFAIVFVVSGCTTAKPTEAEAGTATAATPAPAPSFDELPMSEQLKIMAWNNKERDRRDFDSGLAVNIFKSE